MRHQWRNFTSRAELGELWTPVGPALDGERRRNKWDPLALRGLGVLYVVGRLKDGIPVETARADLAGISRRLSLADRFSTTGGYFPAVIPMSTHQALQALAQLRGAACTSGHAASAGPRGHQ